MVMPDFVCHACGKDLRLSPYRRLEDGRLTCRKCDKERGSDADAAAVGSERSITP
jgi:hypothetical protein